MLDGQANDLANVVMAHDDAAISHFTIGCDIGSIWLDKVNGERIASGS